MSGFLASANAGSLHEKANAACGGDRLLGPADKIRVALCDDHEPFRRGVAEMLSLAGDVEVIGRPSPTKRPSRSSVGLSPTSFCLTWRCRAEPWGRRVEGGAC